MRLQVLVLDPDTGYRRRAGQARALVRHLELGVDGREAPVERADDVVDGEADGGVDRIYVPRARRKALSCLRGAHCVPPAWGIGLLDSATKRSKDPCAVN